MPSTDKSIVGDLINFRGLVYAPLNEQGVVFLFGKVAGDLNMYVEEIKPGFPDCIARRFTGKGWQRVAVEFEFESANFKQHGHDPDGCDIIVCWRHNWAECPIEVIALRHRIQEMENYPVERPEKGTGEDAEQTLDDLIRRNGLSEHVGSLLRKLIEHADELDERVFHKVGQGSVSIYSPERVFCTVYFRKNGLHLEVFTRGEPLEDTRPVKSEQVGLKWASVSLLDEPSIDKAMPVLTESLKRIRAAVQANESTTGYVKPSEEEAQGDDAGDAEPGSSG